MKFSRKKGIMNHCHRFLVSNACWEIGNIAVVAVKKKCCKCLLSEDLHLNKLNEPLCVFILRCCNLTLSYLQ